MNKGAGFVNRSTKIRTSGYGRLRCAIVAQAMEDTREALRGEADAPRIRELIRFWRSGWAQYLTGGFGACEDLADRLEAAV